MLLHIWVSFCTTSFLYDVSIDPIRAFSSLLSVVSDVRLLFCASSSLCIIVLGFSSCFLAYSEIFRPFVVACESHYKTLSNHIALPFFLPSSDAQIITVLVSSDLLMRNERIITEQFSCVECDKIAVSVSVGLTLHVGRPAALYTLKTFEVAAATPE